MEYIDLCNMKRINKRMLRLAKRYFYNAFAVTASGEDTTSHVLDRYGRVIALSWIDDHNRIQFHPVTWGLVN